MKIFNHNATKEGQVSKPTMFLLIVSLIMAGAAVDAFTISNNPLLLNENPSSMVSTSPLAVTRLFAAVEDSEQTDMERSVNGAKNQLKDANESFKSSVADATSSADVTETPFKSIDSSTASDRIVSEFKEFQEALSIVFEYIFKTEDEVTAEDIVKLCDAIDENVAKDNSGDGLLMETIQLRKNALELGRYYYLIKLMKKDYKAYVATASFLSPSRIDRNDLPNVQDVPFNDILPSKASTEELVQDCTLEDTKFEESFLDKILLKIFRDLVTKNTNGIRSSKDGIDGLLEQGRMYMLQPGQTPEAQHKMVYDTLGGLMTPILPPFYRIFMSGIVPENIGKQFDVNGKQFGPWFYAPWLTTIVTPTFFGFLVGPSRPNRRKDGERGGLVVEKCKFLQESGCKGLCLHQCKLPAQQFFKGELGLDLTVSPNFATQECQWSFGEVPLPPEEDDSFPRGCLVGCESRSAMAGTYADSMSKQ